MDAAQRIVESRRRSGSWDGYELKIEPSQFHTNGTYQIESMKIKPTTGCTHCGSPHHTRSHCPIEKALAEQRKRDEDRHRYYGSMSRAQRRRFMEG